MDKFEERMMITGRLVQNCVTVETLVLAWIQALVTDKEAVKFALFHLLRPRLGFQQILDFAKFLVDARLESNGKKVMNEILDKLRKISTHRNLLCHNPILLDADDHLVPAKDMFKPERKEIPDSELKADINACKDIIVKMAELYREKFGKDPEVWSV